MVEPVEPDVARIAVDLAVALRAQGLRVTPDATTTFTAAMHAIRSAAPSELYWAGRATLVRRPEDTAAFDRAFVHVFAGGPSDDDPGDIEADATTATAIAPDPTDAATSDDTGAARDDAPDRDDGRPDRPGAAAQDVGAADDPDDPDGSDGSDGSDEVERAVWSAHEVLRALDLGECTPKELAEAHRLIARLRVGAAQRRSRRRRPTHRTRGAVDLGRTVRRTIRTGGEVTRPAVTERTTRPRRLVLLLDVSGSMEPYARSLLRFAHAGVAARRQGGVEVFTLGTRVTRITRELDSHDPDEALRRASAAVVDWSGGTRLGTGLREFNDRWGVRGIARGATVVLLSDGWDQGEPELLGTEVARLHRVTHRLVWVNPLKASPGYEPLARGMAAALPHVDDFVEGHNVLALETLARLVADG